MLGKRVRDNTQDALKIVGDKRKKLDDQQLNSDQNGSSGVNLVVAQQDEE